MNIASFVNEKLGTSLSGNEELPFSVREITMTKGIVITDIGDTEKFGYFLKSGIVQAVGYTKDEEEKVLDFIFPNHFFNAYISFLTQEPSLVQLSTVTACTFDVVSYDEIQELYKTSLFVNQLGRAIAEFKVVQKTNRELDFLTKSAKDRYLDLLNDQPNFIKDIPNKRIALYLGIHPESLSRIKKELFR